MLHEDRFVDLALGEAHAILLDEGTYLCSESAMYRLLRDHHGQVRERRRQATHPPWVKPEPVAHGPNQCWSWDITKLHGPAKWTYLLPVFDHRHLLPLHRRLDARDTRVQTARRTAATTTRSRSRISRR